jgi:hypothetical protein
MLVVRVPDENQEYCAMGAPTVNFAVSFQDPNVAPAPMFSNHVAVSRAGTEVQFEFVFLDINQLALALKAKDPASQEALPVVGRTVSKVVVPLHVFIQLEEHFKQMFESIKSDYLNSNRMLAPEAEASK